MTDDRRIELEITVAGTPEEVWEAIATGPGISSWYVPHVVEEREGGAAVASFGEGPEMQIPGVVAGVGATTHRIVFTGAASPLAFEWLVEARDGGSCVVRLVNSGFGSGEPWDSQFDGLTEGWKLFLFNLQLHLAHFRGRHGTSMLPMAMWAGDRDGVWARLTTALGIPAEPAPGQRIETAGEGAPARPAGTVVNPAPGRVALVLDVPAPGTAILAVEGAGEHWGVSVWSYLYGPEAASIVARYRPRWQALLAAGAAASPTG